MFWVYGGGFIMGDASEENYLPGPLLDTREVPRTNLMNFQNKKLTPNSISCTFLYFFHQHVRAVHHHRGKLHVWINVDIRDNFHLGSPLVEFRSSGSHPVASVIKNYFCELY